MIVSPSLIPCSFAIVRANSHSLFWLFATSDNTVVTPQFIASERCVLSSNVTAITGAFGRYLEIRRAVFPLCVNAITAATSNVIEVSATEIVEVKESSILKESNIVLGLESVTKEEAITKAGELLAKEGYVNNEYVDAMLEREKIVSTYIGMGIAIPHGVGEAKKEVKESGIVVLQYPNGVMFGDELAYLVIGIAGVGDDHLEILSNIATSLEDESLVEKLKNTKNKSDILSTFNK